jgi:hypothetical protein
MISRASDSFLGTTVRTTTAAAAAETAFRKESA